ncbi:MAG: hypothetical protein QOJ89_1195 [bacterium]
MDVTSAQGDTLQLIMRRLMLTTLLLLFAAPHAAEAGVISLPKVAAALI